MLYFTRHQLLCCLLLVSLHSLTLSAWLYDFTHRLTIFAAAAKSSDSVRPHRRQPTRPRCPWDSPGKNTGVGCHFLLQCMKVESESEAAQSCPTLSDPMDCSLPGSSVHGIFQARVLEWGAFSWDLNIWAQSWCHLLVKSRMVGCDSEKLLCSSEWIVVNCTYKLEKHLP